MCTFFKKNTQIELATKEPKVLHLTQFLRVGGLERVILNIVQVQKRRTTQENNPLLVVYDKNESADSLVPQVKEMGISLFELNKKSGFSWRVVFALIKIILNNKVKVIHSHDLGPLIYGSIVKILLAGQIKIVHSQHSFVHLNRSKLYTYYERFFVHFVNELVVVSEGLKAQYNILGVNQKITCIENGVFFPQVLPTFEDKRTFRQNFLNDLSEKVSLGKSDLKKIALPPSEKIWLLYLARFHKGKGQDLFADMWLQLPENIRNQCALIYVGSLNDSDFEFCVKNKLASLVNQNVYFMGPSFQPENWLLASDIFISASEFEGHPLSPAEALALGCQLYLSKIKGHEIFAKYANYFNLAFNNENEIKVNNLEINSEIKNDFPFAKLIENLKINLQIQKIDNAEWEHAKISWGAEAMYDKYLQLYR